MMQHYANFSAYKKNCRMFLCMSVQDVCKQNNDMSFYKLWISYNLQLASYNEQHYQASSFNPTSLKVPKQCW